MKRRSFIRVISLVTVIEVAAALAVLGFLFKQNVLVPALVAAAFLIPLAVIYFSLDTLRSESNRELNDSVDKAYQELLSHGDIGILIYDDNYEITFLSDFFARHHFDHLGEKLLNWLPELQDMLKNEANTQTIVINDEKFSVSKLEQDQILTFKNITDEYDLRQRLHNEAPVLGLLSYDNYDELTMSEDDLSYINSNIKVPVIDYFRRYGVVYKTLKNNRMLLLLNEQILESILADRFSILNDVRRISKEGGLDITLSLAFSRGSENYEDLDQNARALLELAQTRGGDQVVVRKVGEDAMFYGGTSEAREKQSKTKVRVTANSVRDLISKSSNVIIAGHREMDADCLAAALCMSNIAMSLGRKTYIIARSGGIEPMIADVLNRFSKVIENKHSLISESEAMDLLNEESLVIMVDHHSAAQSNASNLLRSARRIIIIDHHRRRADLDVTAMMMYIEAAASSACELVSEFLPYFSRKIDITPEEANIMYIGILIDTDHFRVRTGSRTFDVAKQLRRYGADPMLCDELSQEPYAKLLEKSRIVNAARLYQNGVIISTLNEGTFSRTLASQACDAMVKTKDVEAAFVICNTEREETVISARSKGKINVQVIMEKMHGGGHMTAAGLQATGTSVARLEKELLKTLDAYFKGGEDESNTAA